MDLQANLGEAMKARDDLARDLLRVIGPRRQAWKDFRLPRQPCSGGNQ
jgi:hypothetical protein